MLRGYFQRIFKNYQLESAKENNFFDNKLVNLIHDDFPQYLAEITPNSDNYIFKSYAGKGGTWTCCPQIAILDTNVTEILKSGYYVIYIFSEDTKRLYLSLTRNISRLKNEPRNQTYERLELDADEFRKKLGEVPKNFEIKNFSLGSQDYLNRYGYANICAKEYNLDNLPSEEELESDYLEILKLYKSIKGFTMINNELQIREFLDIILKKYNGARTRGERVRGHPLSDIFNGFRGNLDKFVNSDEFTEDAMRYFTKSVHFGQRVFVSGPYVYFEDRITPNDFFVGYMFKENMQGVYLALNSNWGVIEREFNENKENISSLEDFNEFYSNNWRKIIKDKTEVPEGFGKMSEGAWFSSRTIYAKYYEKNKLPSEEQLQKDLRDIFRLYRILAAPNEEIFGSSNKIFLDITFFEFLTKKGYLFDPKLVENFLLSLKVKPFIILTGNSGTGKTKVAQLLAQYLNPQIDEEYSIKKHEIVPVGANWTENRHIVGFYNLLTEDYQETQALNLILDASENFKEYGDLSEPYFLILDEMNLSHVERYFSDFLSVMESQEEMPLHDNEDKEVPKNLELPKNLMVVGTVNVDETTYMFSPKVLDRANTIEFLTHNPKGYMQSEFDSGEPSGNIDYLQNPLSDINPNIRVFSIEEIKEKMRDIKTNENQLLWDVISSEMDNIYNELKTAGFDFGFRVVNEIMRFMYVAWKYEGEQNTWKNWERYFDAQIKQKILPKLHGSQRTLQTVIKSLFEICYGAEVEKDPRLILDEEIDMFKYPTAALKLREMDKVLYDQRYVAFIN